MVANFLDDNNREFLQRRRRTAKKNNRFRLAKNQRFSVHFLAVVARLRNETSYFTRPLYGVGEHKTKSFFFLFLNLNTVLSDLTQKISPTFDKLNESE